MKKTSPAFLVLVTLAMAVTTPALERDREKGKRKGDSRPLALQGKELPDVSAFDENGEIFPLRQKLKGRHGVIVFGCLT